MASFVSVAGKRFITNSNSSIFRENRRPAGWEGEMNNAFQSSFVPAISMRFISDGSTVVVTRNGWRENRRFHKLRFYTEKFQDYYERKEKKNRKVKAKPRVGGRRKRSEIVQHSYFCNNRALQETTYSWQQYYYLYSLSWTLDQWCRVSCLWGITESSKGHNLSTKMALEHLDTMSTL